MNNGLITGSSAGVGDQFRHRHIDLNVLLKELNELNWKIWSTLLAFMNIISLFRGVVYFFFLYTKLYGFIHIMLTQIETVVGKPGVILKEIFVFDRGRYYLKLM